MNFKKNLINVSLWRLSAPFWESKIFAKKIRRNFWRFSKLFYSYDFFCFSSHWSKTVLKLAYLNMIALFALFQFFFGLFLFLIKTCFLLTVVGTFRATCAVTGYLRFNLIFFQVLRLSRLPVKIMPVKISASSWTINWFLLARRK